MFEPFLIAVFECLKCPPCEIHTTVQIVGIRKIFLNKFIILRQIYMPNVPP